MKQSETIFTFLAASVQLSGDYLSKVCGWTV